MRKKNYRELIFVRRIKMLNPLQTLIIYLIMTALILGFAISPFVFTYLFCKNKYEDITKTYIDENSYTNKTTEKNTNELNEHGINNENIVAATELVKEGGKGVKKFYEDFKGSFRTSEEAKKLREEYYKELYSEFEKRDKPKKLLAQYICKNYNFSNEVEIAEQIMYLEAGIDCLYEDDMFEVSGSEREDLNGDIVVFSMEEVWRVNAQYFKDYNFKANDYSYAIVNGNEYRIIGTIYNTATENLDVIDEKLMKQDFRNICTERMKKIETLKSKAIYH